MPNSRVETHSRTNAGRWWRTAICGVLLLWIFHVIFCNEAQLNLAEAGGNWSGLSKWEQRRLAWSVGPRELWRMTRRVAPGALLLAFLQCGLIIIVGAFRWHYVLRVQGLRLALAETVRISFVAQFFNAFLLGSTGGDVLKAWYAAGATHHKKAEAVISVFADRLLGIFALLIFAVAMMPWNLSLLATYRRYAGLSGAIVVLLVALGVLVVVGFYTETLAQHRTLARWLERLPRGATLARALAACRRFGQHRGFLMMVGSWSLVINALVVGTFIALANGLGLDVPWKTMALVVPMIVCLAALPITPSGLGVRENLFVYLLAIPQFAIKPAEALTLSLLGYSTNLAWSAIGGLVYLLMPQRGQWLAERSQPGESSE